MRQDSFLFRDATVVEIVDSLFADYEGQGALAPAWRWELKDPAVFPKYSTKTQYQESDFDFLHRLLAAEGISYRFEHEGAPENPTLGRHVLVLSDHNEAFADLGLRFGAGGAIFTFVRDADSTIDSERSDVGRDIEQSHVVRRLGLR